MSGYRLCCCLSLVEAELELDNDHVRVMAVSSPCSAFSDSMESFTTSFRLQFTRIWLAYGRGKPH